MMRFSIGAVSFEIGADGADMLRKILLDAVDLLIEEEVPWYADKI